jgi:hypothetical protein
MVVEKIVAPIAIHFPSLCAISMRWPFALVT